MTGVGSIINTSFNMHEEPIVYTPDDAIRSFREGHLDYLALGNLIVRSPHPIRHEIRPMPSALAPDPAAERVPPGSGTER